MVSFAATLERDGLILEPESLAVLQVHITSLCNQACTHCHVSASPLRAEMMPWSTVEQCLRILAAHDEIGTLDVTGGAPELHPDFERLVVIARELGKRVVVRHNLTVTVDLHPLTGESMSHLPEFFAEHGVELVASLPCYLRENTDRQRGLGVFDKSIKALRVLNDLGYGSDGSGLVLNIAHNPTADTLPSDQSTLERDYRQVLGDEHGVSFNRLFALANMPVNRFAEQLESRKAADEYLALLGSRHNSSAAERVMCRNQVCVGWDGTLYDCDFNNALGLAIDAPTEATTVFGFDARRLLRRSIRVANHCFGCTAGAGSSCCGSTT